MDDLRHALRSVGRTPGFTAVAVLTLAVGIGATSAIFSVVDGVLLRPLPYPDADRIVTVWERPPSGARNVISALNFLDWKEATDTIDPLAAIARSSMTLSGVEPARPRDSVGGGRGGCGRDGHGRGR